MKMIVRVLSGSILFVLVFSPPNGPFATPLDWNTGNSTERPSNTSVLNQTNANTSGTFVSGVNETGIALENGGIPGTGEVEEGGGTEPNVREDSGKRLENKDWTKRISNARDTSTRDSYAKEVDTSTAFWFKSSLLRQQHLETSNEGSPNAADQDLIGKPREVNMSHSSVSANSPSTLLKKDSSDRTTSSSRVYTGSSAELVLKNEGTSSSRKTDGMTRGSMIGSAGMLVKTTGLGHNDSLSTVAPAVDPVTPDFRAEAKVDQTFGTAADDQMTQTDDVRNWKRDVNATRLDVTKTGFAYKSLWDDEETEDEDGKTEADGGGGTGRGGVSRKGVTGGAAESGGNGKRIQGKREENGRFTIPVELRKARNRNEHFSLSFHGLPWRDELNILVPVLCGMFGAMILVLAAYFLRNCPNNIRHLARMSRPSKLHRRKSDLNLLIDYSSGDDHP